MSVEVLLVGNIIFSRTTMATSYWLIAFSLMLHSIDDNRKSGAIHYGGNAARLADCRLALFYSSLEKALP